MTNQQTERLLAALEKIAHELEQMNVPENESDDEFGARMWAKHGHENKTSIESN